MISRIVFAAITLWACAPNCAYAQAESGTVAVIYLSSSKAVIAADSRVTTYFPDGTSKAHDDACKVITLGHEALFTDSGIDGHGKPGFPSEYANMPGWSMIDDARRAFVANDSSLERAIPAWAETVRQKFTLMAEYEPAFLRAQANESGVVANGLFVSGNPVVAKEVVFTYAPSRLFTPITYRIDLLSCGSPIGPYCAIGKTTIVAEFALLASPRARQENAEWLRQRATRGPKWDDEVMRAIRLVDLTTAYDSTNTVGGKIDAVMLENGKVRWIARKETCQP